MTPLHWLPAGMAPPATAAEVERLAQTLLTNQARTLAPMPVMRIVAVLDAAVGRWLDPAYPLRRQAEVLLAEATGYHPAMIRRGLRRFLKQFRREHLLQVLADELPNPLVLDGYMPRSAGYRTMALGPGLTTGILAGNVPALSLQPLAMALLTKSAFLGKLAAGEPVWAPLFCQTLAEVDPDLAACVAFAYWPGADADLTRAALAPAGAVIAYGSAQSVQAVRALAPAHVPFLAYGHRISFGLVGQEALRIDRAPATAAKAAWDAAWWDQQGCVSPQLVYVEEGGAVSPAEFAQLVAAALDQLHQRYPRAPLAPGAAAELAQYCGRYEFTPGAALYGGQDWAVAYDPDPAFAPTCLNRTVRVAPVRSLLDVSSLVAPHRPFLQSAGAVVDRDRLPALAESLGRAGVTRLCPLGRMALPLTPWRHDGRPNLTDLLRWVDIEAPPEPDEFDEEA